MFSTLTNSLTFKIFPAAAALWGWKTGRPILRPRPRDLRTEWAQSQVDSTCNIPSKSESPNELLSVKIRKRWTIELRYVRFRSVEIKPDWVQIRQKRRNETSHVPNAHNVLQKKGQFCQYIKFHPVHTTLGPSALIFISNVCWEWRSHCFNCTFNCSLGNSNQGTSLGNFVMTFGGSCYCWFGSCDICAWDGGESRAGSRENPEGHDCTNGVEWGWLEADISCIYFKKQSYHMICGHGGTSYARLKARPLASFFSAAWVSGLARLRTFRKSETRARMRECMYALEHLMW